MMEKDFKIGVLIGAYDKNKMVGFVAFKELNDKAVELMWMAVEPEYQNHEIGTSLIREGLLLLPKKYYIF